MLGEGGVVEAVQMPSRMLDGHVCPRAVPPHLHRPALHAEGAEYRQVAKIVQVMINRRDAQASHGGEETDSRGMG